MRIFTQIRCLYNAQFSPREFKMDLDKEPDGFDMQAAVTKYGKVSLFCSSDRIPPEDFANVNLKILACHHKFPDDIIGDVLLFVSQEGNCVEYLTASGPVTAKLPLPNLTRFEGDNSVSIPFEKFAEFTLALFVSQENRHGLWGDIYTDYASDEYKFGHALAFLLLWKQILTSAWPLIGLFVWRMWAHLINNLSLR